MRPSTYRVEWYSPVNGASRRQVGTLKWSLSLCVTSTASRCGTCSGAIGKSMSTGMSKSPSSGSIMIVVPREFKRNPAIPSQRSSVPSIAANAATSNGREAGA